jgi:thiaminase
MTAEHPEEIAASPYRFWFDAYTCKEYTDANQMWIDSLDRETEGISDETAMLLNNIFRRCAEYENKLWDALF